jgi:coenzyme F420 hydrogenase subunit beta
LLEKKRSIYGRRLAMQLFGLPLTRLDGMDLLHCWKPLARMEKLRTIYGTIRRILVRRLFRPSKLIHPSVSPVVSRRL